VTSNPATSTVWRLEVSSRCVGSGLCLATAPRYFHLVGGYSQPRTREVGADDDALAAAELCPMNAIAITALDSGDEVA